MVLISWLCPPLCDPMNYSPPGSSLHGIPQGKNTRVGCHSLLQRIFLSQGWNPGFPRCRWSLCHLSHQGRPCALYDREIFSTLHLHKTAVFPGGAMVKDSPAIAGDTRDTGSIPGSRRSPGVGNGNPVQNSWGVWQSIQSMGSQRVNMITAHMHTELCLLSGKTMTVI